jgi:hypothetical protein
MPGYHSATASAADAVSREHLEVEWTGYFVVDRDPALRCTGQSGRDYGRIIESGFHS